MLLLLMMLLLMLLLLLLMMLLLLLIAKAEFQFAVSRQKFIASERQICNLIQSAVWPDWAKIHHFGEFLHYLANILSTYLVFCHFLDLLWQNCCAIGQIFIVENGKNWAHHPAIWSRCLSLSQKMARLENINLRGKAPKSLTIIALSLLKVTFLRVGNSGNVMK